MLLQKSIRVGLKKQEWQGRVYRRLKLSPSFATFVGHFRFISFHCSSFLTPRTLRAAYIDFCISLHMHSFATTCPLDMNEGCLSKDYHDIDKEEGQLSLLPAQIRPGDPV